MSQHPSGMPQGREAEARWRELDRSRRKEILLKGSEPESDEEAKTALAYARRMLERNELMALLGAVSAFVVWLAIAMLVEDQIGAQTFMFAGAVGIAVGLGLGFGGRTRARELETRAEEALERSR